MLDLLFPLADELVALPREYSLVRVSRRAMATSFEIAIPAGSHSNPVVAASSALDLIDELEDQMTVFRDNSEVSRLNTTAADGPVVVEGHLFDLFDRCAGWTNQTEGAFDIATGALVKEWGFFHREPRVPSQEALNAAMAGTGFRHIVLNRESQSVKFLRRGLELNLGAVGKGYALDRAARLLREKWGVRSALLHGGGSSVYAIGAPPGDRRGWPARLKHPTAPNQSIGTVHLRDQGLGTSAATFQFFEYKGQKLGYLLDPRSGWPASGIASSSVVAPSAAEADAISTAAFVLGPVGAERLTRLNPTLGAVLLEDNGDSAVSRDGQESTPTQPRNAIQVFNFACGSYSPPDLVFPDGADAST